MTIKAIDVSTWQHPGGAEIDWGQVKAAGFDGAWIKCSQGVNYRNPYFAADVAAARAAGLVVGAYHFAEPWHNTADAEAAFALAAVGPGLLELGLALDLEQLNTMPPHESAPWAQEWLTAVAERHTLAPLYTDQWLLGQMPGAPFGFPLWIADPSGTFEGAWWAKQTGKAEVPGVQGQTDVDTIANVRGVNPVAPGGAAPAPPQAPAPASPAPISTAPSGPQSGGLTDVNVPTLSETSPGPGTPSAAVRALQALLVDKWGADLSPGGLDGRYGPKTADAVRWVQAEGHGAAGPVDGICGPQTWGYLVTGGAV